MKKIKNLLLKKILSYDDSPTECMYGPPEWYDEDNILKGNYLNDDPQDVDDKKYIDKPHKETDNDRI
ncbi:MAG: hypothetical protein IJ634_02745 [Bacteroidales bacterium]|nr:hypothetical protein [Bacteroidales bacterium]